MAPLQSRSLSVDTDVQLGFGVIATVLASLTLLVTVKAFKKCRKLRRKRGENAGSRDHGETFPLPHATPATPCNDTAMGLYVWLDPNAIVSCSEGARAARGEVQGKRLRIVSASQPQRSLMSSRYLKETWTSEELQQVYSGSSAQEIV